MPLFRRLPGIAISRSNRWLEEPMRPKMIWLACALSAVAPAPAFAFGGIGCTDLPEHDRAVGALEGMTGACDMSVEQAQRILARDGGQGAVAQDAPAPTHHRRHRHSPERQ